MDLLFADEKHLVRLESLKKINCKIDVEKHKRDYYICQDYIKKVDTVIFEKMLLASLSSIERKLKYGRKKLYLFDDYLCVYEEVVETIFKKLASFRGGSLFSTWVYGIMKKALLVFYHKKSKLKEYVLVQEKYGKIDEAIGQQIFKNSLNDFLSVLSRTEKKIIYLIIFRGYTTQEIANKCERKNEVVLKIYNRALLKMKRSIESERGL